MTTWAVIVAGGSGTRFGGPKHRETVGDTEMWRRSVDTLRAAGIEDVVVVGDVPGGIPGGERRRDSVASGLAVVPEDVDWVLVHDAARPLITSELVGRILDRAAAGDVDGVIPAVAVTDTIKRVEGEAVVATLDRDVLIAVQTPQAFRLSVLRDAHEHDASDATDDAVLVERAGGIVVHVKGDPMNFKITFPSDLATARSLLGMVTENG